MEGMMLLQVDDGTLCAEGMLAKLWTGIGWTWKESIDKQKQKGTTGRQAI